MPAAGGPFDLIFDDAPHVGHLPKLAASSLFRLWLNPGGMYVIEHGGTGYLFEAPDG
ncbi:MAG: hypothetical protein ACKONH_06550 [Planctomycetia bacterium]